MQPIGVWRRAVAVILDLIIIATLGSPVWLAGNVFTTRTFTSITNGTTTTITIPLPTGVLASPWTGLFLAILPFAYFTLLEGAYAATPGKMLLGLQVVKLDGTPIGWREAIVRNLLRYIDSGIAYLIGAIAIWTSPHRQRLGDRAAETLVVRRPTVPAPALSRGPAVAAPAAVIPGDP